MDPDTRSPFTGFPPQPGRSVSPEMQAALDRAEAHADELHGTAAELRTILPTRIEAAVTRALGDDREDGIGRRLQAISALLSTTADTVRSTSEDLRAERFARVEDLETQVDLIAASTRATRADLAKLDRKLDALAGTVAELAGQLTTLAQHLGGADLAAIAPALDDVRSALAEPVRVTVEAAREDRGGARESRARWRA